MKEGEARTVYLRDYEAPAFLVDAVELDIDLQEDCAIIKANLQIRRNSLGGTGPLQLDGVDLELLAVELNGRRLLANEYQADAAGLEVFDVPDRFQLGTRVRVEPHRNTSLEGLYQSGSIFCTQCEAEGFRKITYYLDRPDVLSRFRTRISAPRQSCPVLLSNGNCLESGTDRDRHWVVWEDPFPKPAYLFAMVAGNLVHLDDEFVTASGRKVRLQIYTEPHNLDKVNYAMESLKRAMRWDEEVYGREYDLDIFMVVAVDSFNMGAMENKGLNIFNTSCVLASPGTTTDAGYQRVESVVAHEYFHNWSGNRVTCRDWFQLSLKEGFTVFRDQQFSRDMNSAALCRVNDVARLRSTQFPEDAGPLSHPVRPASYMEINNFYTATVYEKGAEVVRMLHTLLGPERFRKGTDLYFERHDGQAVTTEDFLAAMCDANDLSLAQFSLWYDQAGTPKLDVTGEYDAEGQRYTLRVAQSCDPTAMQPEKRPLHMPLAVGLLNGGGQDQQLHLATGRAATSYEKDGAITAVLDLRGEEETFVFEGLTQAPVPSLLRNFSAPVKLTFPYTRDELRFLMTHDSDGFNRWEASQRLAVSVLQDLLNMQAIEPDPGYLDAVGALLEQAINETPGLLDKAMLASMLLLPTEGYLIELSERANVEAVVDARTRLRKAIAEVHGERLRQVYRLNSLRTDYVAEAGQYGQRSLKNICLSYLLTLDSEVDLELADRQFQQADNMTDESAALSALINCPNAAAQVLAGEALALFYKRWRHEALVIDMWFGMQASCRLPGTLEQVNRLMAHEDFNWRVPNRVRALIGSFAANLPHFHMADGSGYGFLADRVLHLDPMNPQVAAWLVTPLTRWHRFDEDRQQRMRAELARILQAEKLSSDLFEIATKSS